MSNKKLSLTWYRILVIILLGALTGSLLGSVTLKKTHKEELKALNDTLTVWKGKDGKNHAKISVLEYENTKYFLDLDTANQEVRELQRLVGDYKKELSRKGSATIIKTETKYDTIREIPKELAEQIKHLREGIFDSVHNRFISSKFGFRDNNSYYNLVVHNNVSVVVGESKGGLFKKRKTFVEVKDENPYAETKSLRTFQVQPPGKSKFSIGPQVGYGFSDKPTPYVGIGLQYNLINL